MRITDTAGSNGSSGLNIDDIKGFSAVATKTAVPLFISPVCAGFPSPADDYIDKKLDLNDFLIKHPAATFFVRVDGDSMIGAGIHSGDILIVDRAIDPKKDSVIIASLSGELTVKRIKKDKDKIFLVPENPDFRITEITADVDFQIWGVVTHVIHDV
jgi:DNA polymerase V